MKELLSTILVKHFFVSSAIIKFIAEFVIVLIQTRDINLTEIALAMCGDSKLKSCYRRLQRFFKDTELCSKALVKMLITLANLEGQKLTIILDRTNWKFGKKHINILVLSVEKAGFAVPLLWSILDNKGGNSNVVQRSELLEKFINIVGVNAIDKLLADREFVGDKWLNFLSKNRIKFYVRIRSDITIGRCEKELVTASSKVKDLKNNETLILKGERHLGKEYLGPKVRIGALRNNKGDLVIIATNDDPQLALEVYRDRWAIENLFGALKTRGFNFENTHMTEPQKITKLLALLAIAFTLCHVLGICCNTIEPIKFKKSDGRKRISFFRYGLDYLRQMILSPHLIFTKLRDIYCLFQLLVFNST
jgi:hypothetical protein